jgi:hypothetical protein
MIFSGMRKSILSMRARSCKTTVPAKYSIHRKGGCFTGGIKRSRGGAQRSRAPDFMAVRPRGMSRAGRPEPSRIWIDSGSGDPCSVREQFFTQLLSEKCEGCEGLNVQ